MSHPVPLATAKSRGNPLFTAGFVESLLWAGYIALWIPSFLATSDAPPSQGLFVVQGFLWTLLACGALAFWIWQPARLGRLDRLDISVALWIAWCGVSTLAVLGVGDMRAAVNGFWQNVAFALALFVGRRLLHSAEHRQGAAVLIVGCTTLLAAHGLYQFFVLTPENIRRIEANPQQTLQEAGVDDDLQSPEARLFLSRATSVEPLATFALTNTLAGCLLPAVTMLIVTCQTMRPMGSRIWWLMLLMAAVTGLCLLLTRSRTAVLALLATLALVWLGRRVVSVRWLGIVLAILGVLAVVAIATGLWNREIWSEAPKSLLYRLEYWYSTAGMIRDHWLCGVGPGNFQSVYPLYMLPQASEEIADPHNFVLELAATAGLPGLALFVTVLVNLCRLPRENQPLRSGELSRGDWSGPVGCVIGLLVTPVVMQIGGIESEKLLGVPLAWSLGIPLLLLLARWLSPTVAESLLARENCLAAMVALLINLLAAGGISFPSVMLLLALLAALYAPARGVADEKAVAGLSRYSPAICFLAACALCMACYWSCYRCVLAARYHMNLAEADFAQGFTRTAIDEAELACEADPLAVEPWLLLGRLDPAQVSDVNVRLWNEIEKQPPVGKIDECLNALLAPRKCDRGYVANLLLRNRRSARLAEFAADAGFANLGSISPQQLYDFSIARAPHDAMLRAKRAWSWYRRPLYYPDWPPGGIYAPENALSEAREALRLDALHQHAEQKLAQRVFPETFRSNDPQFDSSYRGRSVEELMHMILNENVPSESSSEKEKAPDEASGAS